MGRSWPFGQKLALGFALTVALSIMMAAIALYALNRAVASKDRVISVNARNLTDAAKLEAAAARKASAVRGYLLSGDDRFLAAEANEHRDFLQILAELKGRVFTDKGRALLAQIEQLDIEHQALIERANKLRAEQKPSVEKMARFMTDEIMPMRDRLDGRIDDFASWEQTLLDDGRNASSAAASTATMSVMVMAVLVIALAIAIAVFLTKTLSRQVGSAVQDIQSSSAELQATATQQATGAREQATALSEITTTISELLATSRQIAESAQRVSQISAETGNAAAAGDKVVLSAHESVGGIKKQVDLIVNHMLDLGRKSQQIGGIVDIINELTEQTNILAINATIEAAGAGENGKRFAVVADEIRKLADRVGGSTKDIRTLIEEIRAAVNSTVMATEGGTKAVDAGTREFSEVTSALGQINALVSTTTDAAREIELSTKQQTTAVEQVKLAVSNVAQVSREAEVSTVQALKTASQLAELSRDLSLLIQPQANGTH
jgi:methyl-accepting chemotaxis protein